MRLILTFFIAALALFGQAREIVLCDNQSPRNCFSWDISQNLGSNLSISGPVLPTNGETSGAGRGTMTGHMLLSGGFDNAGTIKLGSNIDAIPDTGGIYGAAQSTNDCTFPPAWSPSTIYNVGDISSSAGITYTSVSSGNQNHMPPNISFWTPGCIDDRTRMDWLGFEGVFFRIKAHGTGGTEIGDYFDWTRYGATNALPVHQVNFQDSSFNVIIHIDEDSNFRFTNFDYSGEIRFGLNSVPGVTTGITQNAFGVVEINNGIALANAGTAAQLRVLGVLANQNNDSSGYIGQFNGGIEMSAADATHNILSKGTNTFNAISAPNGGISAGFSSTDLSLSSGAIVGSQFEAIAATSNTSIMGMGVIAGSYTFLASGASGSAPFLPMIFQTSNAERMRLLANGNLLIGTTVDTGPLLNVNGTISTSGSFESAGNVGITRTLGFASGGGQIVINGGIITSCTNGTAFTGC